MEGRSPLYITWIIIADIVISIGSAYIPRWVQDGEISYTFIKWLPDQLYAAASWVAKELIAQHPYISMFALICAVSGFIIGIACYGPFFRDYNGIMVMGFMFPGIMLLYYLKVALYVFKLLFTGIGLKMLREDRDYAAFLSALVVSIVFPIMVLLLPYILSRFFIRILHQSTIKAVQFFVIYCLIIFVIFIIMRFIMIRIYKKERHDYSQSSIKLSDVFLSVIFEIFNIVYLVFIIYSWYLSIPPETEHLDRTN